MTQLFSNIQDYFYSSLAGKQSLQRVNKIRPGEGMAQVTVSSFGFSLKFSITQLSSLTPVWTEHVYNPICSRGKEQCPVEAECDDRKEDRDDDLVHRLYSGHTPNH